MGLAQLISALVLVGLFSYAIINFAIGFAEDNHADISIADDVELNSLSNFQKGNATSFVSESEDQYYSILNNTVDTDSGVLASTKTLSGTIKSSYSLFNNVLRVAYSKITGGDEDFEIFYVAFMAIVLSLIIFFVYKAFRGIPD